jgi:RNA polymerase sigma-70 factor (ECF subfamily)
MTDVELIQNYLVGDLGAFNRLVWHWEKPIYHFIFRMLGDPDISRELSQQTFIRVFKNLQKLKEPEKFRTWIYQIAANLCRDEIRKRQRSNSFSLEKLNADNENGATLPQNLVSQPRHAPDIQWGQAEAREIIERALKKIPEEQRIVIIMKEYQGLKFTEIAEILNQSVNTIKSRMYYGLNALRKIFEQWEIQKEAFEYDM